MKRTLLGVSLALFAPALGLAQSIDEIVAKNIAARGGADAWRAVSSLRFTGRMSVGRGLLVPYALEQKRPRKMRLEYTFSGQTAVQSSDGKAGWKLAPFRGQTAPEPMSEQEVREAADSADPYGLLFDYAARGHVVEFLGREPVLERDAFKLKVTLPGAAVRWVYLDAESGLEVKVEALRKLAGREQRVETFYRDWQPAQGLLIPRRQETRIVGAKESNLLTVETVAVNPPLEDSRFAMSASAPGGGGSGGTR